MAKKAFIVWATVGTRVVVDEDTDEETICEMALPSLLENLKDYGISVCEDVLEDFEVPYDPEYDDAKI